MRLLPLLLLLTACTSSTPERVTAPPVATLAPQASTSAQYAAAACTRLRLAVQLVRADGAADQVRTELAAARALAGQALQDDGRWAALSGAAAALDEAVRRDDAAEAAVAIRAALDSCGPL